MGSLLINVRGPDEAVETTIFADSPSTVDLPAIWTTDVDVICVPGAACSPSQGEESFDSVEEEIVRELIHAN